MAADFPTSIPSIVRVLPTDLMDGPGTEADVLHNDLADEVEALATVVGVTGSLVPTTVEARIVALQTALSGFPTHDHSGGDGGQIAYTTLSSLPTLGTAAALNVGTTAGTVAAGDDARLSDARAPTAHSHVTADVTGFAAAALAAAPAETEATVGTLIAGSAAKATPVDADSLAISDSAAAGILKRLSLANLKTVIATSLNGVFARLAGLAGGQTLTGGTAAGENLTLLSTSNATKGAVIFGASSEYDHANDRLGVGTLTPGAKFHALSTTEQLRLGYDASNYAATTVSSAGVVANTATGGQWTYRATSSSATLGAELITNGDFATNLSGWTDSGASWSWSAGTALHTAGSSTTLSQAETVTNGATYQIGITITGRTAGSIAVSLGAVSVIGSGTATAFTATFTRTLVADTTGSVNLVITPTSDFNGAIDNVTLKLVTLGSLSPVIVLSDSAGTASVQLRASTASLSSLAVGLDAQRSMTAGTYNSAFGQRAQQSLTVGSSNSAVGSDAQYSLTIGRSNVAMGTDTQRALISGTGNIAIGHDAQRTLTTGLNNVAIGLNCQYSLINNAANVAVGVNGQYSLTTGANNAAIGLNAQRFLANGSTAATIADNSVYIGANTKQSADSVTNENVFGYNATGIGSNSCVLGSSAVTKCQLYGDVILDKTITAAGTTGAQTLNKTVGSVNFAAAASSLVVTNSRVTTSSVIVATVATNDATMKSVIAVAAAGSFTLTANAAATAETRVNFIVIN